MRKQLIYISLIMFLCFQSAFAQILPSNFEYQTKINENTKDAVFILTVNNEAANYSDKINYTFEALLFEITPSQNEYDLILLNAKKEYEFKEGKNDGGSLILNDEIIQLPEYSVLFKREGLNLKFEAAGIRINKEVFDKITKATNITIQLGTVKYILDKDNLVSIDYFSRQVEKSNSSAKKGTKSSEKVTTTESVNRTNSQEAEAINRVYIRGPKGGCYYINSSGNKTYVARSYCGN